MVGKTLQLQSTELIALSKKINEIAQKQEEQHQALTELLETTRGVKEEQEQINLRGKKIIDIFDNLNQRLTSPEKRHREIRGDI